MKSFRNTEKRTYQTNKIGNKMSSKNVLMHLNQLNGKQLFVWRDSRDHIYEESVSSAVNSISE